MELISIKDFVLKQDILPVTSKSIKEDFCPIKKLNRIINYAKFLNQPLTHSMFYPADDNGEMMQEPQRVYFNTDFDFKAELSVYNEAKAIVLFEGFSLKEKGKNQFIVTHEVGGDYWVMEDECLEDIVEWQLELTESASKKFQLSTI